MSVIEINNLSKSFGDITALKSISLDIEASEIFGFIGPDGAGKTTLFRILVSLLIPDEGIARVAGYDVVKEYKEIRKRVGYMAGRFSLYHDLTVEENLQFYATVFGTSLKENYDLIKDVYSQIEPFKKRTAGALSGGMKQKLALSCALIHRPEILVLDEPTTGVDAVSRKEFWDLLNSIRKEGITIVVSTPYMDEALRCDRVGLIQKSELMAVDTPQNIIKQHTSPLYSIRSGKSNYHLLKLLREEDWCKSAWLFGQDIHISLYNEIQKEEEVKLFGKFNDIETYLRISPVIEDAFIDMMGSERK